MSTAEAKRSAGLVFGTMTVAVLIVVNVFESAWIVVPAWLLYGWLCWPIILGYLLGEREE